MTKSNTSNNKKGVDAAMAGNHIEAENFFRRAIKENRTVIEGSMNLIRLLHKQGRHDEAINTFKELKAQTEMEKAKAQNVKNQTNVQINGEVPFGQGNYGELMKKLLKEPTSDVWKF